ncbi:MAG TPA: protein kinase [Polyangiaceae bacterium]|nr:protein kinase [Polyangiaceae bacterium]
MTAGLTNQGLRSEVSLDSPNTIGKYRLVAELGRGGAACVYLAVARGQSGINKLVVLKRLLPQLAEDPIAVSSFLDEARLAAQLNHPNVVQTYEVGSEGEHYFLVMEYLEGQSLSRILRAVGYTFPQAIHLRILVDVLEGLHYAHELASYEGAPLRLVHRDVSPQNVLVTYDGQVKVLDFGIAKATISSTHTATGMMKGKVPYMAPEQMNGGDLDRRADIFSVGSMLWGAVAGQKLWKGLTDVQIVSRVLSGQIPSPREVNPNCPAELARITQRALALNPDDRYSTAHEFQQDLEQYLERHASVRRRDVGLFVSQTFTEPRAELKSLVERELSMVSSEQEIAEQEVASSLRRGFSVSRDNPATIEAFRAMATQPVPLPEPQPSRPRAKRRWWAAATLALLGFAGWWHLRSEPPAAPTAARSLQVQPKALVVDPTPITQGAVVATSASSEPGPDAAPIARAKIRVSVSPQQAQLTLDGTRVTAEDLLELPIDGREHVLMASAPGYETMTRNFEVTSALETIEVALNPARRSAASTPVQNKRPAVSAASVPASDADDPIDMRVAEPAARKDCDNPFFVDARGIKRVRPECR